MILCKYCFVNFIIELLVECQTTFMGFPPFQTARTSLPVPMFQRNDFKIWSVLKNSIGKELSKITMPVICNEPLSFLQRMTEYMEYARLIRIAADQEDPIMRMKYVAGKKWKNMELCILNKNYIYQRVCCICIGVKLGTTWQTVQSFARRNIWAAEAWVSHSMWTGNLYIVYIFSQVYSDYKTTCLFQIRFHIIRRYQHFTRTLRILTFTVQFIQSWNSGEKVLKYNPKVWWRSSCPSNLYVFKLVFV